MRLAESRAGMVTVYDDHGQYAGCMGVELWQALCNAMEVVHAR